MHILFVCGGLGGGGAERVAVNLANALVRFGVKVTIFARSVSQSYPVNEKVELIASDGRGYFKRIVNLRKLLSSHDFDAVVSFTDTPNIDAFFALYFSNKNMLYFPTIHTDIAARDKYVFHDFRFSFIKMLHRKACRAADKVIVVSKGGAVSLSNYYRIDDSKIECVYNPVLMEDHPVLSRKKRCASPKNIRLVAAGRFTAAKNYRLMLDAVCLLNKSGDWVFTLDIYGQGEEFEAIRDYAKDVGVLEHVRFNGFVNDLNVKLIDYDIFVFSSNWEGFGNVLVEALCAGLPVVSTDCPSGPREILSNGKFGRLVPPGDVAGFVKEVIAEVENPIKVEDDALRVHLDQFRENFVAKKYIEVIENVQRS